MAGEETKTKEQLLAELSRLREQVAQLDDYAKELERARQRADQRWRRSQQQYQRLSNLVSDAVVIHRAGRFVKVNRSAAQLYGVARPEELIGKSLFDFVHPDEAEALKGRLDRTTTLGEPVVWVEQKMVRADGTQLDLEVSAMPVTFHGQPAIQAILRDITGRKQAEKALGRSEANLRAIVDNSLQAFILLDRARHIQAFNQKATQIFGTSLRKDHPFQIEVSGDKAEEFGRALDKALAGESATIQKKIKIAEDDNWHQLEYNPVFAKNGQVVGVCLSATNINTLRESVDNLTQSEARLLAESQSVLAITRALVSELNIDTLLEFIVAQAEHLMYAEGAAVFLLSHDHRRLEVATFSCSTDPFQGEKRLSFMLQGTLAEKALATGRVQLCNHTPDNPLAASICTLFLPATCQSILCAPLQVVGKNLGILLIWSQQAGNFSTNDSRLISLFSDQAALALHNAHLHAKNRQLAVEQERHRLARDLHDSVTQALYSIGLAARSAIRLLDQEYVGEARQPLDYIHSLSQTTLAEIREQLRRLHPKELDEGGIAGALNQYCKVLADRYSISVAFTAEPDLSLSTAKQAELYYIAREALWNVVKHAGADSISIELSTQASQITLSIGDDGLGFQPAQVNDGERMGLRNMQERARLIGGTFELDSRPGRGTRITVRIPIDRYS